MSDQWGTGAIYDRYMERWSRPVAAAFIEWLDVGCGTGALMSTIRDLATPGRLCGIDPSAGFVDHAGDALGDGTELRVGDAGAISFESSSFDATVSGLAAELRCESHR